MVEARPQQHCNDKKLPSISWWSVSACPEAAEGGRGTAVKRKGNHAAHENAHPGLAGRPFFLPSFLPSSASLSFSLASRSTGCVVATLGLPRPSSHFPRPLSLFLSLSLPTWDSLGSRKSARYHNLIPRCTAPLYQFHACVASRQVPIKMKYARRLKGLEDF